MRMDSLKNWCRGLRSTIGMLMTCYIKLCLFMLVPWSFECPVLSKLLDVIFCFDREREQPARFAQPGTFEFEYASRWKALDEMEKQQREQVDRNIREAKEKLEAELESAKHEHQLMLMRQGRCTCLVHQKLPSAKQQFYWVTPICTVAIAVRFSTHYDLTY